MDEGAVAHPSYRYGLDVTSRVGAAQLGRASWILVRGYTAEWPVPRVFATAAWPVQVLSNLPYAMAGQVHISDDRQSVIILAPSGSSLGMTAKIVTALAFGLISVITVAIVVLALIYLSVTEPAAAALLVALLAVLMVFVMTGLIVNTVVSAIALPGALEMLGLHLPGRRWTIYGFARHPAAPRHPTDAFEFAARTIAGEVAPGDWLVASAGTTRLARVCARYGFRPLSPSSQVIIRPT